MTNLHALMRATHGLQSATKAARVLILQHDKRWRRGEAGEIEHKAIIALNSALWSVTAIVEALAGKLAQQAASGDEAALKASGLTKEEAMDVEEMFESVRTRKEKVH